MTPADRAHQVLAVASAAIASVAGTATIVGDLINTFGGHVTGMDVTAKTTLASGGVLVASKLIDSVNDALRNRPVAPMASAAPVASLLPAPPDAAVIRAIGQSLATYGSTPSTPPKI